MKEELEEIKQIRRKKIEDRSIEEMRHEQLLVDYKIKEINDDWVYKEFRGGRLIKEYESRFYISEQISSQKKRILGVDQLIEDPSSSGQKDLVFVKSLADDIKVSIPGVERP
ncbi:hypothetical protein Tco_0928788 [Tanacetum coccineum]